MRVLVCGGRNFRDRNILFAELDRLHADWGPFKSVIQGGADGADRLAKTWAEERGIECVTFPADWKKHGKRAGPLRNQQMIDEGKPDFAVSFPGGAGTHDMMTRITKAKIVNCWVVINRTPAFSQAEREAEA